MKLRAAFLASVLLFAAAPAAHADQAADALGQCLVAKSTGADRVAVIRWLYASIAAHPTIAPLSAIPAAEQGAIDRAMAAVVDRLLTVDCLAEVRAVSGPNAQTALQSAFGKFGEIAMAEIFASSGVQQRAAAWQAHLDPAKLNAVLSAPR